MTGSTEATRQSSVNDTDVLRTLLVNIMYSEASMLQVSISQCIVLSSPGLSPINLRLHVPVELPLPFPVYRQISILTLDFQY